MIEICEPPAHSEMKPVLSFAAVAKQGPSTLSSPLAFRSRSRVSVAAHRLADNNEPEACRICQLPGAFQRAAATGEMNPDHRGPGLLLTTLSARRESEAAITILRIPLCLSQCRNPVRDA